MKVSDIVINFLESKNISHVFTISGGGCIHLIDSLGKSKSLNYICTHHEQSAAIAAEGYARLKEAIQKIWRHCMLGWRISLVCHYFR